MSETDQKSQPLAPPATRHKRTSARTLAAIAIAGFGFMILVLIAFHFIQPELDPLKHFGSEYAAGRLGWLLNVGFIGFAVGLCCLAITFGHSLQPPVRSRVASVLLGISSLGILMGGLFNADLQGSPQPTSTGIIHDLSGFVAFLTMIPAMFVLSRRHHLGAQSRVLSPLLRYVPWLVLLLFLALLFVFEPFGLVGLGQRLFLVAMFTWLLSAAYAVYSGASTLSDEARVVEEDA